VLQTRQFEQVGSSRTVEVDVRIIAATNRDLEQAIQNKEFREDLYYRLNVIDIAVPPLAERAADILPLARHFLGADLALSEDAAAALLAHEWPGNVRELRNSIERAKLLARDRVVSAADLNLPSAARSTARDTEQLSREVLEATLREAGGNISRAAQSLGLSRQALYRRMERFNLRPP
jgi:DNA-binding NtrC family response regulator